MCNMEHETEQLRPLNDYKTYHSNKIVGHDGRKKTEIEKRTIDS